MSVSLDKYRTKFEDYSTKYESIEMKREDGVLELTLHTGGDSLRWSRLVHAQLEEAFLNIGRDRGNKVIILTGVGAEFSGPIPDAAGNKAAHKKTHAEVVELGWEVKGLLTNMLAIDVPMICAVNGPAQRHAELPVLCDIVIASDTATFQDSAHFVGGLVPGDGVHIVFPAILGLNRGRYFLLTGQIIKAQEAKDVGLISEVLPREQLMPRARELAQQILRQPEMVRRYARVLVTEQLRRHINELLPLGFALEGQGMTAD